MVQICGLLLLHLHDYFINYWWLGSADYHVLVCVVELKLFAFLSKPWAFCLVLRVNIVQAFCVASASIDCVKDMGNGVVNLTALLWLTDEICCWLLRTLC